MSVRKPGRKGKQSTQEETSPAVKFPIVAIGASAGGVEAFTALLKALPLDLGMAYVFVMHLDPTHESSLREILVRATAMPVVLIQNGLRVQPDHLYVIPKNCQITIAGGVLKMEDRDQTRRSPSTVDVFMRSLAEDAGTRGVGIVLSGTASDGTLGLAAIKAQGGVTFAQDGSAKFDGMPSSAINAGAADMVLTPAEIARELARVARHPYMRKGDVELETVGKSHEEQLAQVFSLLRRAHRVDFSEYKPATIQRRLARRMALHKMDKLGDYVSLLQQNRNEVATLYQDLLINVTSFFRDHEAFEALKQVVYPELVKERNKNEIPLRIWVPGCSTGEEPYSHAMALLEYLTEQRLEIPVQIFGTDLSETAVQRARIGVYKESIETDVSPARLRRFFHRTEGGYQISKTIRDLCVFSSQNVFSDPPFSRIDLLSCRNVMIYLGSALQRRVIPIIHYALNPGGYFMIGNTEGLLGAGMELFEIADRKQKIYRKKPVPTPVTFGFSVRMAEPQMDSVINNTGTRPPEPSRLSLDMQREADRLLLLRYAPPTVVVNQNLEIIQTKGHTGAFLELPSGKASLNLLKMARPGLLYELQNAIDEAGRSGVEVLRSNVQVDSNGGSRLTNIRVTPFRTPMQEQNSFLVAFELPSPEAAPAEEVETAPLADDERVAKDKQIAQLRQELAATKEYLQSIIETLESTNEELQSANEEIQSGNEELQSTNEELQTSKEELESANEELHTVNEEMQHRNEQLTQANNDLTNLLNSVNLPMVMVGPDLSVRRFTPQATKVLGLGATDVGRPIARLKLKVEVPNLEQMMLDVISEVQPKQDRVKDVEGKAWDLRLTPYRTADNRIDGVVLSVLSFDLDGTLPSAKAKKATKGKSNSGKKSRK